MRVLRLVIIAVLLTVPLQAFAYDVLVLQSSGDKGYQEAVKGLRRECQASYRPIVLSDYAEIDITRIIREEHPRVIVAVGDRAVAVAQKQHMTPVVYMLALKPKARDNATGVGMLLDPAKYVSVFEGLGVRRVGVVYNPANSGVYVKRAQSVARRSGIELVTREVRAAKETPAALQSLTGNVDALWMLPDGTAVSPESTEAYFLLSQSQRIPVVSFSDVYLKYGGAVAVAIDLFDIGKQAGEMAESVLAGTPVKDIPSQSPRRAATRSNDGVLRRLNLTYSPGGQ